jgi:hypothetical protein
MAYNETPTDWTAMFRNREIRIKLAKTPKGETTPTFEKYVDIDIEKVVKQLAIGVGIGIATFKVIDILGEIIVKKTKSADDE